MNDHDHRVALYIDRELLEGEYIGVHPCINTSSLRLKTADLMQKILPAMDHKAEFVSLSCE